MEKQSLGRTALNGAFAHGQKKEFLGMIPYWYMGASRGLPIDPGGLLLKG